MVETPDLSFCFLKIRLNFADKNKIDEYLTILTEYIRLTKVEFTDYTAGCHYKCTSQHFHYHLILNTNIKNIPVQLKNPNYHFKKKYILEKKGLKDFPTYSIKAEALYVDDLQPDVETATNKFLRYPLKEGHPIRNYCSICTEQLDGMIETAKEEFRFAEEQKLKTENEQKLKISKWNEIRDYLDSQDLYSDSHQSAHLKVDPHTVWLKIAGFMRNDTIPPTLKQIDTMTERYLLCRGDSITLTLIGEKRTKQFYRCV